MSLTAITFLALALVGCGGHSLTPQDADALHASERLCGYAYQHADGGPIAADTRACYCAVGGVLARHELASDDAGIRCPTQ